VNARHGLADQLFAIHVAHVAIDWRQEPHSELGYWTLGVGKDPGVLQHLLIGKRMLVHLKLHGRILLGFAGEMYAIQVAHAVIDWRQESHSELGCWIPGAEKDPRVLQSSLIGTRVPVHAPL
jgi:hypothetical protein